jgi:SAM-dependent methyltransferase
MSKGEFEAMNSTFRRLIHRFLEYPLFVLMGLHVKEADVLEIGCGSGYGAKLLYRQRPRSYLGIDVMPEQIALARELNLPGAEFRLADASDLSQIEDASKDAIVIFNALHHIPSWRNVIAECYRILRSGGRIFIEEPDGPAVRSFDRWQHWTHPDELLLLRELDEELLRNGFINRRKLPAITYGIFAAQKP